MFRNERLQSVKIMQRCLHLAPFNFPQAFARSLVAIATQKDDSYRRLSLEMLRDLSVHNPDMMNRVNGFKVLLDAVIDPDIESYLCENILLSLLYLLNSSSSRQYGIDILSLLSPLSDLDSYQQDFEIKCKKSIDAFIVIMKSMPGIIILASDSMGLNVLIHLLTDPQISKSVQSILLDGIHELFLPLIARDVKLVSKFRTQSSNSTNSSQSLLYSSSTPLTTPSRPLSKETTPAANSSPPHQQKTSFSIAALFHNFIAPHPIKVYGQSEKPPPLVLPSSASPRVDRNASVSDFGSKRLSQGTTLTPLSSQDDNFVDPLFNALDSYAALLCCSFLHANLFRGLCILGTTGDSSLMEKSKSLLLDVLLVATRLFPVSKCAEFLKVPELIDFATAVSSANDPYQAHKASGFLISIANEFSSENMYRKKDSLVMKSFPDAVHNTSFTPHPLSLPRLGFSSMGSFRTIGAVVSAGEGEDIYRSLTTLEPTSPGSQKQVGRVYHSMSFPELPSPTAAAEATKAPRRRAEATGLTNICDVAEMLKVGEITNDDLKSI